MSQNKTREGHESFEDILYVLLKVAAHFIPCKLLHKLPVFNNR